VGELESVVKGIDVGDDVVSSQDEHDSLRVVSCDSSGAPGDGGSGVTSDGFAKDMSGGYGREMFMDERGESASGHDPGMFRSDERVDACQCFLNHAPAIGEG
jgi:hypothetical protein